MILHIYSLHASTIHIPYIILFLYIILISLFFIILFLVVDSILFVCNKLHLFIFIYLGIYADAIFDCIEV